LHRDILGCEQVILPDEENWMTAGRGITHSERFDPMRALGGRVHGIQAWVGLPTRDEETDPTFHHFSGVDLPVLQDGGLKTRIIAGEAFGARAGCSAGSRSGSATSSGTSSRPRESGSSRPRPTGGLAE
jgi:redox-sensitive bicupin YhaK (pirin superfamily)